MKELNSVFLMKKSRWKTHQKDLVENIEEKIRDDESDQRTKTTEFDQSLTCSIKLLAVQKKTRPYLKLIFQRNDGHVCKNLSD